MLQRSRIISLDVHNISFNDSLEQITTYGLQRKSGFVCFANVHMTIEAHNDPWFREELRKALFVLPDGKPLALACGWLYNKKQERISGMDFMPALLEKANSLRAKIFLYGSTVDTLDKLITRIGSLYPQVIIAGKISPPFRKPTAEERDQHIRYINDSEANFVLVALGCPKQEKWMAENYPAINSILLGLGGAFLVVAGIQKRSPVWMQNMALEWLYRLVQEPKRMFKRYVYTNLYFMILIGKDLLKKLF